MNTPHDAIFDRRLLYVRMHEPEHLSIQTPHLEFRKPARCVLLSSRVFRYARIFRVSRFVSFHLVLLRSIALLPFLLP